MDRWLWLSTGSLRPNTAPRLHTVARPSRDVVVSPQLTGDERPIGARIGTPIGVVADLRVPIVGRPPSGMAID